jgi:hypothetical protein
MYLAIAVGAADHGQDADADDVTQLMPDASRITWVWKVGKVFKQLRNVYLGHSSLYRRDFAVALVSLTRRD